MLPKYLVLSEANPFINRLFVDRSEAKSVFGQNPGGYHGFANDYTSGGTYKVDGDRGPVVGDLKKYTKFKLLQKDLKPRLLDGAEASDTGSKYPRAIFIGMRSASVNSEFRNPNNSHYNKFVSQNYSGITKQKSENKLTNLYDYIKADGNRTNNSMVFNHSMKLSNDNRNNRVSLILYKI